MNVEAVKMKIARLRRGGRPRMLDCLRVAGGSHSGFRPPGLHRGAQSNSFPMQPVRTAGTFTVLIRGTPRRAISLPLSRTSLHPGTAPAQYEPHPGQRHVTRDAV